MTGRAILELQTSYNSGRPRDICIDEKWFKDIVHLRIRKDGVMRLNHEWQETGMVFPWEERLADWWCCSLRQWDKTFGTSHATEDY
jgi:hypothetical protein